jgi:phosphoglycolate phosphatase-like HAD superfamily hydrolase
MSAAIPTSIWSAKPRPCWLGNREAPISGDPLPSWSQGIPKAAILEFLSQVTEPGESFVPPPQRVAVFDNDGTLWCEKPMFPQADFLLRRWREMAQAHPGKTREQPWKAVAEDDRAWLAGILGHVPELTRGVTEAYEGITTEAFEKAARRFFDIARHPAFGVPYTSLAYRPMRELISLLKASRFRVYICTAGGRDFVRVISKEMYGIPRERVIGSGTTLEYRRGRVWRTKDLEQPIDDGPGKPVHIWKHTGRMPLLAGGNGDGDVGMLERARFALLIRHDDAGREFAYDAGSEQALVRAKERGWTVVSMQNDFKVVFDL